MLDDVYDGWSTENLLKLISAKLLFSKVVLWLLENISEWIHELENLLVWDRLMLLDSFRVGRDAHLFLELLS